MSRKKILITGVSGMLGSNLAYCLRKKYDIVGWYWTQPVKIPGVNATRVDVSDVQQVEEYLKISDPDIVIHCAAQANVDMCDEKPKEARRINVAATKNLALSLGPDTKLIFISSDLVYDGKKGRYCESDKVHPLNVYGQTKVAAEKIVSKVDRSLILRTNFFGFNVRSDKFSIAEWVIHELKKGCPILGFSDAKFSSIYTFDLAKLIDRAIERQLSGIFHCGSCDSISKYHFLRNVAQKAGLPTTYIQPISVSSSFLRAKRSKNLSLNTQRLSSALDLQLPSVKTSIDHFIRDHKGRIGKKFHEFALYPVFPLTRTIPYSRQSIDQQDIDAVVRVLRSGYLTQGPRIADFEQALCRVSRSSGAVAVNSGTSALHLACLAAGVRAGDEALTSPNSFVASANCVVYCGGVPVFTDIDPRTYNISPEQIEKKISRKTKAVIPVHFAGQSCDMKAIQQIVKRKERAYGHKIFIIEDASHALGSMYKGQPIGSCAYSDMTVTSFHPVKHITTGEGGVILTNNKLLEKSLRMLRSHGITSDKKDFLNPQEEFLSGSKEKDRWYYEQQLLGFNYRITDIQCALGLSQLSKLPSFVKQRRKIVEFYDHALKGVAGLQLPFEQKDRVSNFHLYVVLFDFKEIGLSRSQVIHKMLNKDILTQVHYIPIHTQPFYRRNFGTGWGDCPVAEDYYNRCLSLPLFPEMTLFDAKRVANTVKEIVGSKA